MRGCQDPCRKPGRPRRKAAPTTTAGPAPARGDGTLGGDGGAPGHSITLGLAGRHPLTLGAITVGGTPGPMAGQAAVSPDGTVTARISFDARSLDSGHRQRMASMTALGAVQARFTRA